jgi:Mn-dependent DtxR family transcriptional regulator
LRISVVERVKADAVWFLKNRAGPSNVADLARHLNVAWTTARQILMELQVENLVSCERTTNGLVCRAVGKNESEV